MRSMLLVGLVVACGGGAPVAAVSQAIASSDAGSLPSDVMQCGDIAAEYRAAFLDAIACDAATPDACTEWRPLTVASVGNGGNTADAKVTGLCYVAGFGYVTPQRTAPLDAIIDATRPRAAPSATARARRRALSGASRTPPAVSLAAASKSEKEKEKEKEDEKEAARSFSSSFSFSFSLLPTKSKRPRSGEQGRLMPEV